MRYGRFGRGYQAHREFAGELQLVCGLALPYGENLLQAEAGVSAIFGRFQEYECGYILRVHSLFVFYFGLSLRMHRLLDLPNAATVRRLTRASATQSHILEKRLI